MLKACSFLVSLLALVISLNAAAWASEYATYFGSRIDTQPMGENLCCITFDDGPGPYTPQLLDKLDEYGIPATFFMLGKNAQRYPDVVQRAAAEGHEIGSHSYSHPNLKRLGQKARYDELAKTSEIFRSLGIEPRFLRPPYGAKDDALIKLAAELGLSVITWSRDSEDWKRLPSDYAKLPDSFGHIAPTGHLRGIFLFHDIHKRTVDDLPRIVEQLRAGGCQRFVTVSDYFDGFYSDPEPPLLMTRRPVSRTLDIVRDTLPMGVPIAPPAPVPAALPMDGGTSGAAVPGHVSPSPAMQTVTAWSGLAINDAKILPHTQHSPTSFFNWLQNTLPSTAREKDASESLRPADSFFKPGETVADRDADGNVVYIEPIFPESDNRDLQ